MGSLVTNLSIQLTYGTTRTYNATWGHWFSGDVNNYKCNIQYHIPGEVNDAGKPRWHAPSGWGEQASTTTYLTFPTVPDNVDKIRIKVVGVPKKVIKESIVEKGKKKKKVTSEVDAFADDWTDWVVFTCGTTVQPNGDPTPTVPDLTVPSAPSLSLSGYTLTISASSSDANVGFIGFEIYRDGTPIANNRPALVNGSISQSIEVYTNGTYTARVCAVSTDGGRQSGWSEWGTLAVNLAPPVPAVPSVEIKSNLLTVQLNNLSSNTDQIEFQIVRDDTTLIFSQNVNVSTSHAQAQTTVAAGGRYKARARAYNNRTGYWSGYSEYSSNVATPPPTPSNITSCVATSTTSVELKWTASNGATSYEVEYTKQKKLFDTSSDTSSVTVTKNTANITGLETGNEWFFRVRAKNDAGSSGWCPNIASVIIGEKPAAPNTWSDRTVIAAGKDVILYWVHNSKDNSSQTYAQIEVTLNGVVQPVITVKNTDDAVLKDKTSQYKLDTSTYTDGSIITWRVRTRGVLPEYGDWSIVRQISVYEAPSIEASFINEKDNGAFIYPIRVKAEQFPKTQKVISYYVSIIALETHECRDYTGEYVLVSKGTVMYSNYIYTQESDIEISITPRDVTLASGIEYEFDIEVATDVGLTATWSDTFSITNNGSLVISANVEIDYNNYSASIRPIIKSMIDDDISDAMVSIYRKENDGTFVLINDNIPVNSDQFQIDPYPSLDYVRYRVVVTLSNGFMYYEDLPTIPVGIGSIVLQWDTTTKSYDVYEDEDTIYEYPEEYSQTGYLLDLPYNIDISDNISQDVEHVQYIGRKHPVSYHGTQLGETSMWSVEVPMEDTETLSLLRQLRVYMGNVYVREPSGSGYWATVAVSYSRKHNELTMPVTLTITRVEGDELLNTVGEKILSSPIVN